MVTGESAKWFISNTNSGGVSVVEGSTGVGNRCNASAFTCSVVLQNFRVYSNIDKYKYHLRILAYAWGDVGLYSPSNPNKGL